MATKLKPKAASKQPKAAKATKAAKAAKVKKPAKPTKVQKLKLTELPTLKHPKLKLLASLPRPKKPGHPPGLKPHHRHRAATGGAVAMPQIGMPLAGPVPAGVNLQVQVGTNRGDLGYVVELQDTTVVASPVPFVVPPPHANNFTTTIPGGQLVAAHSYHIRAFVDPGFGATPPHGDSATDVNAV